MNPNWIRWIHSSIIQTFISVVTAYNLTQNANNQIYLYIEGRQRPPDPQPTPRFELRIDGPFEDNCSGGTWVLTVDINLLIIGVINNQDAYLQQRLMGIASSAFKDPISVYQYGDDNTALVECLIPGNKINVTNFGLVESVRNVFQSTVERSYRMVVQES